MAPHTPHTLGSAPAQPGPSSTTRSVPEGRMPPTPTLGSARARLLDTRSVPEGPTWPPTPPDAALLDRAIRSRA